MDRIPLRKGGEIVGYALVDDCDAYLAERRWRTNARGYAIRREGSSSQFMHRVIMGLERGNPLTVDHINRDKLDNRRANLRIVTLAQNQQNVASQRGSMSRYRGVSWDSERQRWIAAVWVDGHCHRLGRFADEDEAGAVAAAFRAEHMPFSSEAQAA